MKNNKVVNKVTELVAKIPHFIVIFSARLKSRWIALLTAKDVGSNDVVTMLYSWRKTTQPLD
jgi:hypothetical protein